MKLSSLIFFFIFLDTGQAGRVLETSDQCRNIIEGCSCPLKTQPHYLRCKGLQSDLPVILDSLEAYDIRLLDLSLRKLTNLRKNVLNTTKLSALVISSSQLTTIETDALATLRLSLTALSLPSNLLRSIPDEVFSLHSLTRLELNQNHITYLSQKLSKSANLEFLNLNGNFLNDLNSAQIPEDLQILLLKNNHLQKSSVAGFQFSQLQELDLSYNQFNGTLNQDTFQKNSLRKLDLSFNHLTDIQNHTFQHFTHLKNLNLRSNNIQLIDTLAFADLPHLKTLDLSSNGILELPLAVFQSLSDLETLDLSFNHLQVISGSLTSGLINLHTLNLGHNDIIKLEPLKDVTRTLSTLLLDFNSLECTCQLKAFQLWLQSLSHLSLNSKRSIKCSLPSKYENAVLNNLEPLTCISEENKSPIRNTEVPISDPEEFQLLSQTILNDQLTLKWGVNISDYTCDQVQLYQADEDGQDVQFYSAPLDCVHPSVIQVNLDLKKVGILTHNIHPVSTLLACATILKSQPHQEVITNCTKIHLEPTSAKRPLASLDSIQAQSQVLGQVDVTYQINGNHPKCQIHLQIEAGTAIDVNERIVSAHNLGCQSNHFSFNGLRVVTGDQLRVCAWLEFGPAFYHTDSQCANVILFSARDTSEVENSEAAEKLINRSSNHQLPILPLVLTLVFLGVGIAALVVLYLIVKGYLSDRHKAELFQMRFCSVNHNNNATTNPKPPGLCLRWTWRFFAWKRRRHHRPLPNDELMLREDSTFDTSVV